MPNTYYSVKLKNFVAISDKCYKAVAFDGSEALIPKSQVAGRDLDVAKSEAYWISEWILERKDLQYSTKKSARFDKNGKQYPNIEIERHIPQKVESIKIIPDETLVR